MAPAQGRHTRKFMKHFTYFEGYWNCGHRFVRYIKIESPCSTPETNIRVYVNYTLIFSKGAASAKAPWLKTAWSQRGKER